MYTSMIPKSASTWLIIGAIIDFNLYLKKPHINPAKKTGRTAKRLKGKLKIK